MTYPTGATLITAAEQTYLYPTNNPAEALALLSREPHPPSHVTLVTTDGTTLSATYHDHPTTPVYFTTTETETETETETR